LFFRLEFVKSVGFASGGLLLLAESLCNQLQHQAVAEAKSGASKYSVGRI
jgi:hypothetical protein